ncbi:MAG: 1-aminocyclopropane-carboxylate deaminase-like protein [Reyranella sp.]|nr:1-aminocyclopropane-carboxylate deaminase-like protein [Reyranella sp.]
MDLSRFPRRIYTNAPTHIEHLPHFTKALAASCPGGVGPDIWIKRDDMLGLFPGGNKTRKLEFLAGDALAQGCDTLVTCGAPQSNHCRITLAAAVKEGMKCRFVIEERVPGSYKKEAGGNNFMFELMGVEAITVVPGGTNMGEAMSRVAQEVASLGRKAYVIPGGGSNAIGGLGYVACVQEMQVQWLDMGLALDAVVVGSGSSGTHGGMVAGFLGNNIKIPLIGVGVSRDPADQEPLVVKEAQAVSDLLGLGIKVPASAVKSFGGYWQPKYSVPNAKMVEAVQMLARTEGILLDPVYTGKIMAGLIGLARQGHFKPNAKVLFIHTGGLPSLHVYEDVVLGRTVLPD